MRSTVASGRLSGSAPPPVRSRPSAGFGQAASDQIRAIVPVAPARWRPSGDHATEPTPAEWPVSVRSAVLVATSHTLYGRVAATGCQPPPVWRPRHRPHVLGVADHRAQVDAAVRIPHPGRLILAGAGEPRAVR